MNRAGKENAIQIETASQGFKPWPFRTVAGNNNRNVRFPSQCVQKLIEPFFRRETAEVKQVALVGGKLIIVWQSLKVGEDFDALGRKTAVDQLMAYEFARGQKQIDATLIGPQPPVEIRFRSQHHGTGSQALITTFRYNVVEGTALAFIAGAAVGDAIVGWTQHLEIVDVIKNWDGAALEFPKDRWRQVVIDPADVSEFG